MNRLILAALSVVPFLFAACGGCDSESAPPTHVLSGNITQAWGGALPGVAVTLGGAASGTAMTDASGRYTFPSVSDGTYTVTPALAGYAFTPSAPSVVVSGADRTQDFSADGAYVISGTVTTAWATPLPGASVALGGGGVTKAPVLTDAAGHYAFTVPNGTFSVTPTLAGYVFTPAAPSVVVSGASRTQDLSADGAYVISGTVSGAVSGGVSIALVGGGVVKPVAVTAAGTGLFAFVGIPDGTYTLTPALAGYTFTPAAASVSVMGASAAQDFTSSLSTLAIGGTVHDGAGAPLAGMTLRLSGATNAVLKTDATGAYAFTGLTRGQSYTVTPATFGYSFDPARGALGPASRTYSLTADVTGADFGAVQAGPVANTFHGSLGYAGSKTGPVYLTVGWPYGGQSSAGGTGLASQPGPWSRRAFSVRNAQIGGPIRVRAWIDTLGVGRFNAGADPSAWVDLDTSVTGFDLGELTLMDPSPAPTVASPLAVDGVLPGDQAAVVVFKGPTDANGDPVADSCRVSWNTSAADWAHPLGTIVVPAGPDFAIVHGLTNGTGYYFRAEAYLGGAPLGGQVAVTSAPATPAPPAGSGVVSGVVHHPAVASPSALYVIAQGNKGAAGAVWFQRIENPADLQTAYSLSLPPGMYQLFAFLDVGDDGAVAIGEPAIFPNDAVLTVTVVAGPNAGPAVTIPTGNAIPSLRTRRWTDWYGTLAALVLDVGSNLKVPVSATVDGPGLRGPVDLGFNGEGGGPGIDLGTGVNSEPILPFVGDVYSMLVTYSDGTTEPFQRPVTGIFGGPPGVLAPAQGEVGVSTVPTFAWSPPPLPPGPYSYTLHVSPQSTGDRVWETFLAGSQTSVVYGADGMAPQPQLAANTTYGWTIRAVDANGNDASQDASFTTGAAPPPVRPVLPSYDPLTAPTLDGQRWQTPQFTRSVSGGKALLAVRADAMQARTVQGTVYANPIAVQAGAGNRVTTLRANVTVPSSGADRSGTAVLQGGLRLAYQPAADRGRLFPGAQLNVLTATLELFEDGSGLQVRRRFYHCDDAPCVALSDTGLTGIVDPAGFTRSGVDAVATAAYDTTYALEVSLDEATGVFTWSVLGGAFTVPATGTASVLAWATGAGMDLATTANGFSGAQLFARVADQVGEGSAGVGAEFDEVWVGFNGAAAALWDDFETMGSTTTFSPARWGAVDSDVWLAGGSLHLASALTTAAAGGGGEGTLVNVMYPASFTAWQADLAIVAEEVAPVPGSAGNVGILGACYNDGTPGGGATGDVRARVSLQSGAVAFYWVFKCTNPACSATAALASGSLTPSPAHPLGVGTVHTILAQWEAAVPRLTFWLDDAPPVQVDPTTANPGVPAPVSSPTPRYPLHVVSTGVSIGGTAPAGTSARLEATVADFRASPP